MREGNDRLSQDLFWIRGRFIMRIRALLVRLFLIDIDLAIDVAILFFFDIKMADLGSDLDHIIEMAGRHYHGKIEIAPSIELFSGGLGGRSPMICPEAIQ